MFGVKSGLVKSYSEGPGRSSQGVRVGDEWGRNFWLVQWHQGKAVGSPLSRLREIACACVAQQLSRREREARHPTGI